MVDKPRSKRSVTGKGPRSAGKTPGGAAGARSGRPVTRPRPRSIEGVSEDALEKLHEQGLLSTEGKQLRLRAQTGAGVESNPGPRPGTTPRAVTGQRPKPERGDRPTAERPKSVVRRPGSPSPQRLSPEGATVAQRLHKVMAHAGLASRRHSEELIQAGRVSVNGVIVKELGAKAIPGRDLIEVDGRPLGKAEDLVYVLLNKPKGYVTTLFDPQGRQTVTDLIGGDISERIYPVGRLDYETEGLLLLTNDGELANALMHPARMIKKTYIAKVRGVPGPAKVKALESGIELEDGVTAPAEVKLMEVKGPNSAILSIKIHEGRNRQVRRMFEAIGHETIHLKRLSLGPLHLQELPVGQWRNLTETEVSALQLAAGVNQRQFRPESRVRTGGPVSVPPRPRSTRPPRERPDSPPRAERSARPTGPRPDSPPRTERSARPTGPRPDGPARPERSAARVSALGAPRPTGETPRSRTGPRTADSPRPQRSGQAAGPKRGPGPKKFGTAKNRSTK